LSLELDWIAASNSEMSDGLVPMVPPSGRTQL
jgi:hypothetical protein